MLFNAYGNPYTQQNAPHPMSEEEQIPGHLLINDVIISPERLAQLNREAEAAQKIAAETGLPGLITLNDQGESVWTPWPPRE
jgi:hypothetical protein